MTDLELKSELLQHCKDQTNNRYVRVKQNIADIEESLLEESKSSAGDKHETGRAMLQIDRENVGKQLQEIENIQAVLKKIDIKTSSQYARLGSLVYTTQGTYFISISIGEVKIGKGSYYCISLNSPIGQLIIGKSKGDDYTFNGKEFKITSVV